MFDVEIRRTFSAAHQLRGYDGDCRNLHGHNYSVVVNVRAEKLNSIYGQLPVDSLWNERVKDNQYIQKLMTESDYDVNNQVTYYTALYEKGFDENR